MKLEMAGLTGLPDDVDGLRVRAAGALERALAFVESEGDAFAVLRAHVILQAAPAEQLIAAVSERQRDDGLFASLGLAASGGAGLDAPVCSGLGDTLLGTLEALMVLGDLSLLHAPCVAAAARRLEAVQNDDGSFGDPSADDDVRLFATGMLAGLLGRTLVVRPGLLDAASAYMAAAFSPERVEQGGFGPLVACATFFSNVHHDLADEALQWVGRALEKSFRSRRLDAVATLRVLLHADAAAIPGASLEPPLLLAQLLGEQAADGGFAELETAGAARRVAPSLDAMLAVLRLAPLL